MKVRYMSNGGFIMDDYINTSETQQLKSAIQYIITGFLFASLTIDIGWIPEIEGLISVLWFFIGLRMTKGLNRKLKYAYYFGLYFLFAYLFTTIVNIQTPFTIPSYSCYFKSYTNDFNIFRVERKFFFHAFRYYFIFLLYDLFNWDFFWWR